MVEINSVSLDTDVDSRVNSTSIPQDMRDSKWIVRRGTGFHINMRMTGGRFDNRTSDIRLVFQADVRMSQPQGRDKTCVDFVLSNNDRKDVNGWNARILNTGYQDGTVTAEVFTSAADTCVGRWNLSIEVLENRTNPVSRYRSPAPLYILFNPWNRFDGVCMQNIDHLREYVMNEAGVIYVGNFRSITPKPWYFGQFEDGILDTVLDLLDKGQLEWGERWDPVAVARKLAAMVSSHDDNGVVVGEWDPTQYGNERKPMSWTGSVAILQRYRETGSPVKFGQCFIYSGVATTVMRAIGIPCRSVTNYESAHDTDGSITIELLFDTNGKALKTPGPKDSVWNFHVWNEVWMARPDLAGDYGGWQVADSTPQEVSNGVYVCGPVPVKAIKQGETTIPYDAPFVFAEVNGDVHNFTVYPDGTRKRTAIHKNRAGKSISTKACHVNRREDITHQYKAPEGTAEERRAVQKANQQASNPGSLDVHAPSNQDCSFTIKQDSANTWVGQEFRAGLLLKNNSSSFRQFCGTVAVSSTYYSGGTAYPIKSDDYNSNPVLVDGRKERLLECVVMPWEYVDKLTDVCTLEVTFWITVRETGQVFTAKEQYRLRKPHLNILAPRDSDYRKPFILEVSFQNPLDKMLTNCVVEVDGPMRDSSFRQRNVPPRGKFHTRITITPTRCGQRDIIVIFSSTELEDINGVERIFIRY